MTIGAEFARRLASGAIVAQRPAIAFISAVLLAIAVVFPFVFYPSLDRSETST